MTHEFLPSVEESYHRLLEHIPGMAYRCRVEKARGSEQGFEYVLEFVSRGSFDLLGIPAGDMIDARRDNSPASGEITPPKTLLHICQQNYKMKGEGISPALSV